MFLSDERLRHVSMEISDPDLSQKLQVNSSFTIALTRAWKAASNRATNINTSIARTSSLVRKSLR